MIITYWKETKNSIWLYKIQNSKVYCKMFHEGSYMWLPTHIPCMHVKRRWYNISEGELFLEAL